MELPSISHQSRGFTLVELMVATTIIVVIFSLGLFLSFDFYRGFAFLSEQKIIVSILEKARSQSLNNINQKPHGVYFNPGCYIIFEGTYDNTSCNSTTNEVITVSPTITISGMSQVIFSQLSGDAVTVPTNTNLTVSGNGKSAIIKVSTNGQIDIQ